MELLEKLRKKIAGFPGYDGDAERRRSDEYVRSYLGEALTEFAERCNPSPEVQARFDELLLRVGFADPRAFAVRHVIAGKGAENDGGDVAAADAATIELADRAASLDFASAASYLDDVERMLAQRDAAIRAVASHMS